MSKPVDRFELEDRLRQAVEDAIASGDRKQLASALREFNALILDKLIPPHFREQKEKSSTASC